MPSNTTHNDEPFDEWLGRRRAERGLTQRDLANAVGVGWSMISKFERGDSQPRRAVLAKIRTVLEPGPSVDLPQGTADVHPSSELDHLVDDWAARHELLPRDVARLLAAKIARLL